MKPKNFDAMLLGVGAVAKVEIAKALAPIFERLTALETENKVLREALQKQQTLTEFSPEAFRRAYDSLPN